jgi:hypothetical protein
MFPPIVGVANLPQRQVSIDADHYVMAREPIAHRVSSIADSGRQRADKRPALS